MGSFHDYVVQRNGIVDRAAHKILDRERHRLYELLQRLERRYHIIDEYFGDITATNS